MSGVLLCLFYIGGCLGVGGCAIPLLIDYRDERYSVTLLSATALLIGCLFYYCVWLTVGVFWGFSYYVITLVLMLGNCFLVGCIFKIRGKIFTEYGNLVGVYNSLPRFWGVTLLVLLFGSIFVFFQTVNSGVSGDAEACYAFLAKYFSNYGAIIRPPSYELFVKYGFWTETHFTILYFLGGLISIKSFIFVYGLLAAYFTGKIAENCGAGAIGVIIAWILVFTSTVFTRNFVSGKTDSIVCAVGIAACFWLIEIFRSKNPYRISVVCGMLIGSAILAKISYVPILGIITIICVIWQATVYGVRFAGKGFLVEVGKRSILCFLVIGVVVVLCSIPHLVKNYHLFNDPFAPFTEASLAQVWFNTRTTAYILKIYPIAVTFGLFPMQVGNVSPLVLFCLPFFLRPGRFYKKESSFGVVFVSCVLSIVAWKFVSPSMVAPRYIMAAFFLFFSCCAVVLEKSIFQNEGHNFLKFYVGSCMMLGLLIGGLVFLKTDRYNSDFVNQMERVNKIATTDSVVVFYGYYGYYLRDDLMAGLVTYMSSKESIRSSVTEKAVEFVLVQSELEGVFKDHFPSLDNDGFRLSLFDQGERYKTYRVVEE